MKIIVFTGNNIKEREGLLSWYNIADSALSNTGKPFYLPDDSGEVTAAIGLVLKISKLGKYIHPRFASRYYNQWAPAVHFCLKGLMDTLYANHLPVAPALSFDRSLMVGDFINISENPEKIKIGLKINDESSVELNLNNFKYSAENLLHEFSKSNTVKMGDLLIPAISIANKIRIGDILDVTVNDETAFTVKVK